MSNYSFYLSEIKGKGCVLNLTGFIMLEKEPEVFCENNK